MGQKLVRLGSRGQGQSEAVLTEGLEVERHKLAAHIPEELWHVVGRVHTGSLGVDAAELLLIVSEVGSQGPCGALDRCLPPGPASNPLSPPLSLGSSCPVDPPLLGLASVQSPRPTQNPDRCWRVRTCLGGISRLRTFKQASECPWRGPLAPAPPKDTPQTPWGSWSAVPWPWSPRRMTSRSTCSSLRGEQWEGVRPVRAKLAPNPTISHPTHFEQPQRT